MRKTFLNRLLCVALALSALGLAGCASSEEKADTKPTAAHPTPYPGAENSKFVMPTRAKGN